MDNGLKAPVEDYLAHLVFSIPAPPRGIATVKLSLLDRIRKIAF